MLRRTEEFGRLHFEFRKLLVFRKLSLPLSLCPRRLHLSHQVPVNHGKPRFSQPNVNINSYEWHLHTNRTASFGNRRIRCIWAGFTWWRPPRQQPRPPGRCSPAASDLRCDSWLHLERWLLPGRWKPLPLQWWCSGISERATGAPADSAEEVSKEVKLKKNDLIT